MFGQFMGYDVCFQKPWDNEPAGDMLDRYLSRLQAVVDEAAERFAEHQ